MKKYKCTMFIINFDALQKPSKLICTQKLREQDQEMKQRIFITVLNYNAILEAK